MNKALGVLNIPSPQMPLSFALSAPICVLTLGPATTPVNPFLDLYLASAHEDNLKD